MFSSKAIFIGGKCSFLKKWEMPPCCIRGGSRKYLYEMHSGDQQSEGF